MKSPSTDSIHEGNQNKSVHPLAEKNLERLLATKRDRLVDVIHGETIPDPYRWLETETSDEVKDWMAQEDKLARDILSGLPGREPLAARFRELFYAEASGVPIQRGQRRFFMRTHLNQEKAILYVQDDASQSPRVLLDPNGWSADGAVSLGSWVPSPDGKKVAYLKHPNAADEATLHVVDVATGKDDVEAIEGAKYAWPSWSRDSRGFWYGRLPTDGSIPVDERPGHTAIYFHTLGEPSDRDVLVHQKTGNPETFIDAYASTDGSVLFVSILRGWNENDIYALDLKKHESGGDQDKNFTLLAAGVNASYEYIATFEGHHYFATDENASGRRVLRVNASSPDLSRKNWVEVVPERQGGALQNAVAAGGRLLLAYLEGAESRLYSVKGNGDDLREVALPGVGSITKLSGEPNEGDAFFGFTGFTTPREVHRLDVTAHSSSIWATSNVKEAFKSDDFITEKVFYPSKDGTQIPLFLVHKRGITPDGNTPTLLYGYGGFMVSMSPSFRAGIIPWLEQGGIYAVPCLRGGGEFGKAWHDAGRGKNKQNVFDDFIAAGEWLIAQGWTRPEKLAIWGGSNGGLLVGAVMTQRPDLYGAVICAVPLLDMLRYHLFGSGRTWVPEYGSAQSPEMFPTLRAYSPYANVKDGTYPAMLMLSADHDDRVDPMHARKFVAAVRHASPSTPTLLRIERNSGHGGADQVEKSIEQYADIFTFLNDVLETGAHVSSTASNGTTSGETHASEEVN